MNYEDRTAESLKLEEHNYSVKRRFLAMYKKAHAGHIGSSLSCAEILVLLRFAWMSEKDKFILSKGHAAAALYSVLAEDNVLSSQEIDTYYEDGTRLPALPPVNAFEQIPFATGSLGHGLGLSAGMALGARLNGESNHCFCVTSDGELDEGSTWEAALFIAHRRLTNLVWLIDRNRIQGIGRTEDVIGLEPLDAKLRAFGFHVISADGHSFSSLLAARDECNGVLSTQSRPVVIIANTIKGNGISYMHDTVDSHYLPMDDAQYALALGELARTHEAAVRGYQNAN